MTKAATDFRVRGLVQGVGFRPTVYRIALELGLSGTVWNDAEGVVVHLEGESEVLERFPEALLAGKPPLARIDAVEPAAGELQGMEGFSISATPSGGRVTTAVTADASVCDACLDDIFNPNDRRWRYPFANCTHCGPRFTIIKASRATFPTTVPRRPWRAFRCAPTAGPSTRIRSTGASTPSRSPAPSADRSSRS